MVRFSKSPIASRIRTGCSSPSRPSYYGDRYIATPDPDRRTKYHLNNTEPTPSAAALEGGNALFRTILRIESGGPNSCEPTPGTPVKSSFLSTPVSATSPLPSYNAMVTLAQSSSPVSRDTYELLMHSYRDQRPGKGDVTPTRILDAPDLADDFYLNLMDWSTLNVLAVGLGTSVYLWNVQTAAVNHLCNMADSGDSITAVSWVRGGYNLVVGTASGRLHIYDTLSCRLLRTYGKVHGRRAGSLACKHDVISSGGGDCLIYHRDIREAGRRPFGSGSHQGEVCGLKWSPTKDISTAYLASGGNDNKVLVWDLRANKTSPLWRFRSHTAAVKALAWDPRESSVLASGGGTRDGYIRVWNTKRGSMVDEIDTGSQVCNMVWSMHSTELLSTHGFSSSGEQNLVRIWDYPKHATVRSLNGHKNRVVHLAMSPDGSTVVTGSGDETLRFWRPFNVADRRTTMRSELDHGRLIR
ncbi:WD-repeats-region domain-containing protein [Favolaschia claudopus]|uniref:WD-repeats-region domain-containing protein n=1 Tax=Favolaschia claudopus TaxID=2862362 RepID=A0AAW0AMA5_9AGAR